jgi:hypothetical protein
VGRKGLITTAKFLQMVDGMVEVDERWPAPHDALDK